MGVEPKNEQLPPRLGGMPRPATDRTHRQTVIAAEHDRNPAGAHEPVGLPRQESRPGRHMGETMRLAFGGRGMDERKGKREGATVVDVVPKIPERFDDSR